MTEDSTPNTRPRRRRTITVRLLMFLVLLAAVPLARTVNHARSQQRAVAAITRAGGSVSYDWEWRNGKPLPSGSATPWPKWITAAAGPDLLGNVVAVSLTNKGGAADDALMVHVGRLGRLEYLSLFSTDVTDAGVARLQGLTRLKALHLHRTKVRGPGLAYLQRMVQLEDLMLPDFPITDADLAHLAGLVRLKRVTIRSDRVTDAGLAHLSGMRRLEQLELRGTRITTLEPVADLTGLKHLILARSPVDDAGLGPIAGFASLERLDLGGTRITDTGLGHLPRAKLIRLALNHTAITDAGLDQLCGLAKLRGLNLFGTQITDSGLSRLAGPAALPSCRSLVVSGPGVTMAGVEALRSKLPGVEVIGPDLVFPKVATVPAQ